MTADYSEHMKAVTCYLLTPDGSLSSYREEFTVHLPEIEFLTVHTINIGVDIDYILVGELLNITCKYEIGQDEDVSYSWYRLQRCGGFLSHF